MAWCGVNLTIKSKAFCQPSTNIKETPKTGERRFIQIVGSSRLHASGSSRLKFNIRFIQNFFIPPLHLDSSYLWFIQTSYLHLIQTEIHTFGSSRPILRSNTVSVVLLISKFQIRLGQVRLSQDILAQSIQVGTIEQLSQVNYFFLV